jgi:protein subunit release factor A
MPDAAFEHDRNDLHVTVGVGTEAPAWGKHIVVTYTHYAERRIVRVRVGSEREAGAALQPTHIGLVPF